MVKIEISNRAMYFLVTFGIIALFAVGVFAVTGVSHSADELTGVCKTSGSGCDFLDNYATKAWSELKFEPKEVAPTITTPMAPTDLVQYFEDAYSIEMNWLDNSDDETRFEIYRNNVLLASVNPGFTWYWDDDVDDGTTYYYIVRACNNAEPTPCSAWSNELEGTTCDVNAWNCDE